MAAKRSPGSRPGLIRCDHCGEEYSDSYRRCPFCAEYDADVEYETQRIRSSTYGGPAASERPPVPRSGVSRGGKRVAYHNRRGGGYTRISAGKILAWLLSLIVIIAAIWIVITQVIPLISKGDSVDPNAMDTPPAVSQSPVADPSPSVSDPDPTVSDPISSQDPEVSPSPQIPASDTAAGFTLNKAEFTLNDDWPDPITLKVTFSPAGTTAAITWTSSDPDVASVDANGKVSHGSKRGTATITAAMANGVTQTCKVYNRVTSGSAYQDDDPTPSRTEYKLNKTDFTFYTKGESTKLRVDGYTGSIRWSSSNTNVATVSSDGTVKATGTGKRSCTITATLDDGTKLEAIARISI